MIELSVAFPNLAAEIAKRGIKKTSIAKRIGVSDRTLYNKLKGDTSFSWEEVCAIRDCFFPDMAPDVLFQSVDDQGT